MTYDKYKTIISIEEFYNLWETDQLESLTEGLKKRIYDKYLIKSLVFQRDDFLCQNEDCKNPTSSLTMHHIKFQKNKGRNTLKNCVTMCKTCHNSFHKGKIALTFWGATYQLHKKIEVNWKEVKKQSKQIRKDNIKFKGVVVSWELIALLLKWLNISYEEMDLDDDLE